MHVRHDYDEKSLFTARNLLKEARRQKGIKNHAVPSICILDPDGDILEYLKKVNRTVRNPFWPCYHTDLFDFELMHQKVGIIGYAVGSSFAVLVAEELFAQGCELIVSITSAGRLDHCDLATRFILIARALRDEGTSKNYQPRSLFSYLDRNLSTNLSSHLENSPVPVCLGTSWTTDAPFRETRTALSHALNHSADCVEMESAALYSLSQFQKKPIICIAHLTNSAFQSKGNFDKGIENGSIESLKLIEYLIKFAHRKTPKRLRSSSAPAQRE